MPMTIGGQTYTDQQIKDFYAGGGNERQFLQQQGITDPWQARDLTLQARQVGGAPTMQQNFANYQKDNPNGAFANDFGGWQNDMKNGAPGAFNAMQSGTYTGTNYAPKDWDTSGIYGGKQFSYGQSGQGRLGVGDGWGDSSSNLGIGGSSTNSGSGGNYGSSTGSGTPGGMAGGSNPYLQEMGNTIVKQMTDNYSRNQLPAMRSGAMAAGGFGGSRQGVVEANGLRDLNLGIGQNLTNLYGTDWTNSQNRNLQQQSINNSYDLGLKSNDLGFANLDSNNQQFGANYGLNVQNQQLQNQQAGVNAATQMQNTPTQYQTMFNNQQNAIGGQGGTSTSTQNNPGNQWLGALGGYQLANQVYK